MTVSTQIMCPINVATLRTIVAAVRFVPFLGPVRSGILYLTESLFSMQSQSQLKMRKLSVHNKN